MARRKRKGGWGCFVFLLLLAAGGYGVFKWSLQPTASGPDRYFRFDPGLPLTKVLDRLEGDKIIAHGWALRLYARATFRNDPVKMGTYVLHPGMSADEVLSALQKPFRQMVRMPETNWAARSANLLEKAGVCKASEYVDLVHQPSLFQNQVSFPLPRTGSLEGYLYPDTYDFPPLLGAKGAIERQLKNFEDRVVRGKPLPKNFRKALIVGSMVELEVARDKERPLVAGVIENRLAKGFPLQIDACLLYGIQKWRALTIWDYKKIDSPYNVYTHKGLPPSPICSPTVKSIEAALHPARHHYLYYVALPDGQSLFSATYPEHLKNVAKRKAALALLHKGSAQ
jgi:UPF0755 protein